MTPALEKEGPVASTSSRTAQRSQEQSRKGKRQIQLTKTSPKKIPDPQIGAFKNQQCIQYGQNSYGIHSQGEGKDEKEFHMQIMDEIKHIKSSIDVQLGNFDNKLNKITSDIN
ncbi:hypothetical protein O181_051792 [Austropuccinia psidii MF-1]|uniref:Uncharacterized protein n=1 Tax=Austropuccinia psidii MF-1 TaxID=1389203 RepID=A0A9Q3E1M5_9BASI|nr:hypothetical protein [Austropuccinia psidii MF-1]